MRITIIAFRYFNMREPTVTSDRQQKTGTRPLHSEGMAPRRLHSSALFGDAKQLVIEHQGAEYRLRITRQGKLILTK
jgi:hemin uptake protein HemP